MRRIRTKKRCCKSKTRCKKCPVVMKKLEKQGYADRLSKRNWVMLEMPSKKTLKAARAR